LKNENDLIPFKYLDTFDLRIASPRQDLLGMLHQSISLYKLLPDPGQASLRPFVDLLLIDDTNISTADRIINQSKASKKIICFLGIDPINLDEASTIVYEPEADHFSLMKLVQRLFGALPFDSAGLDAFPAFEMVTSQTTSGDLRLGFTHPFEADSALMKLEDSVDFYLQMGLDSMAFPGAQVLVAYKNKVVFHKGYGFHTYAKKSPVFLNDVYDLASITKVSSATLALMYLYDHGLLTLEEDMCTLFPGLCKSNKKDLKIREVLAHQARLHPYIVYWQNTIRKNGKFKGRTFKTRTQKNYTLRVSDTLYLHKKYIKKIHKAIKKVPQRAEPGYVYSGLSFLLWPDLVKEKTGLSLDSFLYQHFFEKLGSHHTCYKPMDRLRKEQIVPTEVDSFFRKQLVHGYVHDEAAAMLGGISGNAGLFSNALDLAKLGQMLLNGGTYGGETFLSQETVNVFTSCAFCGDGNRRGLGFDKPMIEYKEGASYVAKDASPSSFGHSGFTGTFFWMDPETELLFIFLSNRVYPTRNNTKLYSLGIRPRLHQAVYNVLVKDER
jgi:CubicO group peptidase (beta-lactamase class C family)